MLMGTEVNRIWQRGKLLLALCLLTPLLGLCQEASTTNATQDPSSSSTSGQSQDPATPPDQQQPKPAGERGLLVRALNGAGSLPGNKGPLQWGWISVRSLDIYEYFTQANFQIPNEPLPSQTIYATTMSASIVVEKEFKRSRFTLQYNPSLVISDGQVYSNVLNQTMGLDTTFELTPRWGMQITDRFSYYGSQRTFSGLPFNTDYLTGISSSQVFLSGPGTALNNSIGASFSYAWSPVTTVSFAPTFGYQYSTGTQVTGETQTTERVSSISEGGTLTVSHSLSATQTVGFNYSGQHASYTNTSTSVGPQSNALLQDFLVTYSQQLKATWWIHAGVGVTNTTGNSGGTGLGLNLGITKNLRRSNLAVYYNRGHQFNGFVTSGSSDNVGVAHTINWTTRFSTATSATYTRTPFANTTTQSAWYATEQVNFGLTRSLGLSSSFGYLSQVGDGVYVLSSNRRFATIGITWSGQPHARY
jgi:hypothetical protein